MHSATLLALCMFFSGYCGIIAELSLFTLSETLVGGTIHNLLMTMGVMMFSMGTGSWLAGTRFFIKANFNTFICLELFLSSTIVLSIPCITYLTGMYPEFSIHLFIFFSALIGNLIGMEIPIMQKLIQMETQDKIQHIASKVLMADYFGSLLGFALFSLYLLHQFGLHFANFSGACLNFLIANIVLFYRYSNSNTSTRILNFVIFIALLGIGVNLEQLMKIAEQELYSHKIIWSQQTPYQKLTLTDLHSVKSKQRNSHEQWKKKLKPLHSFNSKYSNYELKQDKEKNISFFINGGLQFNSRDEAFYHEFLIHPACYLKPDFNNALIMGGGDGLALREILKYDQLQSVTIVDLDPIMIQTFNSHPLLKELNHAAFEDPRVEIITEDAWSFIRNTKHQYDLIFLDFPDPHHSQTAKLYTKQFYSLIQFCLKPKGILVTQSTSPLLDQEAFMCIRKTLEASHFNVLPCHIEMKSFFQWGFQICSKELQSHELKSRLINFKTNISLKFLNRDIVYASTLWNRLFWSNYTHTPVNEFLSLNILELYTKANVY